MFESKKGKQVFGKNLSSKKVGLNLGGGVSAGKQLYETSVGKRAIERAGKNKNLHGHINEILTVDKINRKPSNILQGKKAVLTKSKTAVRDDIVVKKGGKVVQRFQLKDTTSAGGLRDTINKVKNQHYKGTNLVGTKETAKKYAEKAAKDSSITQKMASNGISSERTKLIAAKTMGKNIDGTGKRILGQSAETGISSAKFTVGVEAVKAGIAVKNGQKDIGSAAGTIANETAISAASAAAGDAAASAVTIATTPILGPVAPAAGVIAGVGASMAADKAIRAGESTALNQYNAKNKKNKKKRRRRR